jgi:hypothetical protein
VRFAQPRNAVAAALAALACCGIMAGCAGVLPYSLKPGASVDEVLRSAGRPGAEHALPGGGHKLEYSSGNQTYMLEFDPQGRLQSWENVLDEAHFNRIRAGITSRQLREQLGEPAMVWRVRYRDQTVWSYRFHGPFCQLFHVGITPAGIVEDTGYGPDPRCEREERSVSRGRW